MLPWNVLTKFLVLITPLSYYFTFKRLMENNLFNQKYILFYRDLFLEILKESFWIIHVTVTVFKYV